MEKLGTWVFENNHSASSLGLGQYMVIMDSDC